MKRPDIGIGYRAAAEVKRLFPKKKHAIIAIGCGKNDPPGDEGSEPELTSLLI